MVGTSARDKPGTNLEKLEMKISVLTYHSIDSSGSVISTTPETFRRQMKSLYENGHKVISLQEVAAAVTDNRSLPEKAVALTFDDGFENFYTTAFPVLDEYGFKATVFLVTDFCGKYNDWAGNPPELPRSKLLSWQEVKELSNNGIEFGGHTRTHPELTKLPLDAAKAEIEGSKAAIEDALGRKASTFAYPFGTFNTDVKRLTQACFDTAVSTNLGKVRAKSDVMALERVDTYYLSNQKLFDSMESRSFDNYLFVRHAMRKLKSLIY